MSFKITTISRNIHLNFLCYQNQTHTSQFLSIGRNNLLSESLNTPTLRHLSIPSMAAAASFAAQVLSHLHSILCPSGSNFDLFIFFCFCFWQINVGSVSGPLQLNKALSPSRNAIEIPRKSSSFLSNASSSCSSFFSRPLTPVPPLTHFPTRKMGTRSLVRASAEVSNFI